MDLTSAVRTVGVGTKFIDCRFSLYFPRAEATHFNGKVCEKFDFWQFFANNWNSYSILQIYGSRLVTSDEVLRTLSHRYFFSIFYILPLAIKLNNRGHLRCPILGKIEFEEPHSELTFSSTSKTIEFEKCYSRGILTRNCVKNWRNFGEQRKKVA